MMTLVLYYSYSGHTKKIAKALAAKESHDIAEIKNIHRPGKLKAYSLGCFAAMRGKAWKIQPLDVDWDAYDSVCLMSPVWAGHPAPAINAALMLLPTGKSVAVSMISASGKCGCRERLEAVIKARGCVMESFEDIKS